MRQEAGRSWFAGVWIAVAMGIVTTVPNVALAGQGVWTSGGPFGGAIQAFAIDPSTPSTLYAGTYYRGVFKSTDSGITWAATNAGLTNLDVHALAVDPATPSTLYVGTYGGGVSKSTDSGATWVSANTGVPETYASALAIDPLTPSTLYLGTYGGGIYRSTDSGATWTPASAGVTNPYIWTLAIDPKTPSTLYTGTYGGGVFKSANAGNTWTPASTGITTSGSGYAGVAELVLDPENPSTLYAASEGQGVFKSTDSGGTWVLASTGISSLDMRALVIDPSTPATLYAGTSSAGVYRSTDSAATWVHVSANLTDPLVTTLAIDPATPSTLYAGTHIGGVFKTSDSGGTWASVNSGLTNRDVRDVAVHPSIPTTLYAATYGGVFRSTDSGSTWGSASTGLTTPDVHAVVIDPSTPTTVYAGTYQGVFRSTNSGGTWVLASEGLTDRTIEVLALDPLTPTTLYAGTWSAGIFKSTDSGASWVGSGTGLTDTYIQSLAIDPVTPGTLYVGTTTGGVFRSVNSGATWAPANTGLTSTNIRGLGIDPTTPTTVYAGTLGHGVFKSIDSGSSWVLISSGLASTAIEALAVHPNLPTTLYAASWSGVDVSTNSGTTWAPAGVGLAGINVTAVALNPRPGGTVYAGLTRGSVWQLDALPDTTAPTNPTSLASTTHVPATWTNAGSISMLWSGASDEPGGAGLAGYSVEFDTTATTPPNETVDVAQSSDPHTTTSASLVDGIGYYFHLRTCDAAGHCAMALHRGPYWIDQTSPEPPTALTSGSHTVGLPSSDRTIDISWTASLDPLSGGVASGIDGYSVLFDAAAASACASTKTIEETTLSTTSASLAAGTWYAHVCAVDNAGNWSAQSTAGPFLVETEADLSITKTDGQASAVPGQSVVYTMVVTNGGTIPVVGARVTDIFPETCATVSWTCAPGSGASCTASGSSDIDDLVNLPAGGALTYSATCVISSSATGALVNTASVAAPASITDPTPGNNTATDTDALTAPATAYYTVVPCRLFDSRNASLGGPNPLASGSETAVAFRGHCGVSAKAKTVSVNVTVTQPSVAGYLTLYPEGSARPLVSAINFSASQTRANNAIVPLSDAGEMTVFCGLGSGSAHVIVDVNGYFE